MADANKVIALLKNTIADLITQVAVLTVELEEAREEKEEEP